MRKALLCAAVALCAVALSRAEESSRRQDCIDESHPKNLCHWSDKEGAKGRVCHLDVEKIDEKEACHFEVELAQDAGDHPPICISKEREERIAFESSKKRKFRVRRLVRINKQTEDGRECPKHPFRHHFNEEEMNFTDSQDTDTVDNDQTPEGCMYKLEVQYSKVDKKSPAEMHDKKHTRWECRDPHIKVMR